MAFVLSVVTRGAMSCEWRMAVGLAGGGTINRHLITGCHLGQVLKWVLLIDTLITGCGLAWGSAKLWGAKLYGINCIEL